MKILKARSVLSFKNKTTARDRKSLAGRLTIWNIDLRCALLCHGMITPVPPHHITVTACNSRVVNCICSGDHHAIRPVCRACYPNSPLCSPALRLASKYWIRRQWLGISGFKCPIPGQVTYCSLICIAGVPNDSPWERTRVNALHSPCVICSCDCIVIQSKLPKLSLVDHTVLFLCCELQSHRLWRRRQELWCFARMCFRLRTVLKSQDENHL